MAATSDFVAAQKQNRRNTLLLLVALTALATLTGYVIVWLLEGELRDSLPLWSRAGLFAAAAMAVASVVWSGVSLAVGDKIVLSMAGAKEIDKAAAPQLYNVVERSDRRRRRCPGDGSHADALNASPRATDRQRHHRGDPRAYRHAQPRRTEGVWARDGPSRQPRHAPWVVGARGPDRAGRDTLLRISRGADRAVAVAVVVAAAARRAAAFSDHHSGRGAVLALLAAGRPDEVSRQRVSCRCDVGSSPAIPTA